MPIPGTTSIVVPVARAPSAEVLATAHERAADDRTRAAAEHLMASALQDRADLVRTNGDPQASDLRI